MFEAENIREWRGQQVVDAQGAKIGELEAFYVDTRTDQFCFATVKISGPLSRSRLAFAPLAGATVGPGYLKVTCPRKLVKGAPSIHTDGELLATDEPAVFKHYGLPYDAGETERLLARR
jgi:PRC-barrel domain